MATHRACSVKVPSLKWLGGGSEVVLRQQRRIETAGILIAKPSEQATRSHGSEANRRERFQFHSPTNRQTHCSQE